MGVPGNDTGFQRRYQRFCALLARNSGLDDNGEERKH